jgi:tRNA(adenine34) deaminase
VFGIEDVKGGAAGGAMNLLQHPGLNHRSEILGGVLREECLGILQAFFKERREESAARKRNGAEADD